MLANYAVREQARSHAVTHYTSDVETLPPSDTFPLRVRVQKTGKLKYDTDLLIDQVCAISTRRLIYRYCTLGVNHLKKVEEALRLLTGR